MAVPKSFYFSLKRHYRDRFVYHSTWSSLQLLSWNDRTIFWFYLRISLKYNEAASCSDKSHQNEIRIRANRRNGFSIITTHSLSVHWMIISSSNLKLFASTIKLSKAKSTPKLSSITWFKTIVDLRVFIASNRRDI